MFDFVTTNSPSLKSTSSSLTSSILAATLFPFDIILSQALTIAVPPTVNDLDPYVPYPNGPLSVSPCEISIFSIGTPSLSAAIWANVVSWPCPWLWDPVNTVTLPVGLNLTSADSHNPIPHPNIITTGDGAIPHASKYEHNPIPLSLPFASDSFFLFSNPL